MYLGPSMKCTQQSSSRHKLSVVPCRSLMTTLRPDFPSLNTFTDFENSGSSASICPDQDISPISFARDRPPSYFSLGQQLNFWRREPMPTGCNDRSNACIRDIHSCGLRPSSAVAWIGMSAQNASCSRYRATKYVSVASNVPLESCHDTGAWPSGSPRTPNRGLSPAHRQEGLKWVADAGMLAGARELPPPGS